MQWLSAVERLQDGRIGPDECITVSDPYGVDTSIKDRILPLRANRSAFFMRTAMFPIVNKDDGVKTTFIVPVVLSNVPILNDEEEIVDKYDLIDTAATPTRKGLQGVRVYMSKTLDSKDTEMVDSIVNALYFTNYPQTDAFIGITPNIIFDSEGGVSGPSIGLSIVACSLSLPKNFVYTGEVGPDGSFNQIGDMDSKMLQFMHSNEKPCLNNVMYMAYCTEREFAEDNINDEMPLDLKQKLVNEFSQSHYDYYDSLYTERSSKIHLTKCISDLIGSILCCSLQQSEMSLKSNNVGEMEANNALNLAQRLKSMNALLQLPVYDTVKFQAVKEIDGVMSEIEIPYDRAFSIIAKTLISTVRKQEMNEKQSNTMREITDVLKQVTNKAQLPVEKTPELNASIASAQYLLKLITFLFKDIKLNVRKEAKAVEPVIPRSQRIQQEREKIADKMKAQQDFNNSVENASRDKDGNVKQGFAAHVELMDGSLITYKDFKKNHQRCVIYPNDALRDARGKLIETQEQFRGRALDQSRMVKGQFYEFKDGTCGFAPNVIPKNTQSPKSEIKSTKSQKQMEKSGIKRTSGLKMLRHHLNQE